MDEPKEEQVKPEKEGVTLDKIVVHPASFFSVKGLLINALQEADQLESVVVCRIYKDGGGAGVVWSDQPLNQLSFLSRIFELDVTEAMLSARGDFE